MSSDASPFLEAAARLGRDIVQSAIWFGGRCNWVGAVPLDASRTHGAPTTAALGPDLYGGTSGVALFLAEAGARLDDDRFRATALAAIGLALDLADPMDPEAHDGLYTGPIGIVLAAARVAELQDADDVIARARTLLGVWSRDGTRSPSSDVMSGCSGTVLGLIALGELLDEPCHVETATRLGDELIARAHARTAGWSWAAPGQRAMHDLCGYAHGAAGIGHALAELFAATGEARFREAAERAFDYERSWLDPRSGTWPDLRGVARRSGRDAPAPAADSWCNGAPGIALSRLRATDLVGSAALRHDAHLAIAACVRHLTELRAPEDFSLCHGAAGVADVLLEAADGPQDGLGDLAAELGLRGIERHLDQGGPGFPGGVPQGETPCLMLGSAGIGLFYLRLSDRRVPSPLLIHRRALDSPSGASIQSHVPGQGGVP
jgi:lantibiotic biosynthesis protein